VAVDATVKAMVELVTRAHNDAGFRRLCETDMEAAVAELETAPTDGARFEYTWDEGAFSLRIHRGGETTTIAMSADGQLTVDNDALGFSRPDDDVLSDMELMAVAGGTSDDEVRDSWGDCGCRERPQAERSICKSACVCYNPACGLTSWIALDPCHEGAHICLGARVDGYESWLWPCDAA